MFRFYSLLLCGFLAAAPAFAQASGEHAADAVFARVGNTIDLEEKAYFGLFTRIRTDHFRQATLTALPGNRLRVEIETTGGAQTQELTRPQTEALAQYVSQYEALRFNPVPPELVAAQQVMAFEHLARPTLAFADTREATVDLLDGGTEQGWILYADEQHLVLYKASAVFDAQEFEAHTVVIAGSDIGSVRVPSATGLPLQIAEAGGVTLFQAALAYATYNTRSSDALYGATLAAAPAAAGVVHIFDRNRIQSPYRVDGNRDAYLRLVRRLRSRVFFSKQTAPELRTWLASLPPVRPEQFAASVRPLRHVVHLMIAAPFSPEPAGTYTRNATAWVNFRTNEVVQRGEANLRNAATGGEIAISPLRWLHLGAEAHRYRSLPSERIAEVITKRQGWAAFAGVTLGDGTSRTWMSKLSLSGGVAQREARMEGFMHTTLATHPTPNNDPNTYHRYSAESSGLYPYGRIMYDLFVSPVTSLSLKVGYVPEAPLEVPEQVISLRFSGNRWNVEQPAHEYTFSPISLSLGLRTHL